MLLAEDVLVLLTAETTGARIRFGRHLNMVLAGAVLLELTALGRIDLARARDQGGVGDIVVRDPRPVGEPILDRELAVLAHAGPTLTELALFKVGRRLRDELYARLADLGMMRPIQVRTWGIFPSQRWLVADAGYKDVLVGTLCDVVAGRRVPSDRERSIGLLLTAVSAVGSVLSRPGETDFSPEVREFDRRADVVFALQGADPAGQQPLEAMREVLGERIRSLSETST